MSRSSLFPHPRAGGPGSPALASLLILMAALSVLLWGCDSGGSLGDNDKTGPPASVSVTFASDATFVVDSTVSVTAQVTDQEGRPVDQAVVRWTPQGGGAVEPDTTTTNGEGEVQTEWTLGPRATGPDAQSLEASLGGGRVSTTEEVTVNPGPVASITMESDADLIDIGQTTAATVTRVEDANGNEIQDLSSYTFSWSAADTTIATVSPGSPETSATVRGVKSGTTQVAVSTGGGPNASLKGIRKAAGAAADTVSITVRHPVATVVAAPDSAVVGIDSTTTARIPVLEDEDGNEIQDRSNLSFSWSSLDPSIASVSANSPASTATVRGEQDGQTQIVLSVAASATSKIGGPLGKTGHVVRDTFAIAVQQQELRGVWLTTVDSDVFDSRANIEDAMSFLEKYNFNAVFPVVWNQAATTYPSTVMDTLIGRPIDPDYSGRDPLQEIIEEAHERGIAVIPWFEYGFAASFSSGGGPIIDKYPSWAAKDTSGSLLEKNGFEWMNPYKPAVRNFMSDLIMEVVKNYDIDGIQGDDRLPANPVEGGYSSYTKQLYRDEHNGQDPPSDFRDPDWMRWRADKLNAFGQRIYNETKAHDSDLLVSWAPSIWSFSYREYLQDWPTWINGGYTDLIHPQVYRRDTLAYKSALDVQSPSSAGWDESKVQGFYPGILLKVGGYVATPEDIKAMVRANRKRGYHGEVYFFYEGFRQFDADVAKALRQSYYEHPAPLPFQRASIQ